MGGVKTSSKRVIFQLLLRHIVNSVDLAGTKPEQMLETAQEAYTWFSSYDAGIVGKAEFMALGRFIKGYNQYKWYC